MFDKVLAGINTAATLAGTVGGFMGGGPEGLSRQDQRYMAHMQQVWQDRDHDFRMNQMKYRAADAERAGLHPLAALGVNPAGTNPVVVGGGSEGPNLGDRLNKMGQNITRAIQAYQSADEREMLRVNLENAKKQGNLIDAQVADIADQIRKRPGNPPAAPAVPSSMQQWFNPVTGQTEWGYTPEYAASIMSSPFTMYGKDVKRIAGAYESGGWPNIWNTLKYPVKTLLRPFNIFDFRKERR